MIPPQAPEPRPVRYGVRYYARVDAETAVKLAELVCTFHRKRGPILRYVMQVGLGHSQGWTLDLSIPASAHLIHIMVEPTLMHHMRDAAAAHHIRVAAWLRHAVRQVTRDDFPASWLAGDIPARSHESGYYYRKFQVRLDADTSQKLEELTRAFHPPTADEIRLLVAQANLQDFPESWRMAADEHRTRQSP